jgi:hypothetical protein
MNLIIRIKKEQIINMKKKKYLKIIAVFLAINIFFDAVYPTAAWALTGGPTQPEVAGFTPVGTSEMVNNFTGDFNYNIPLMDVGGYPINLSYQSGITMDQEASWVGLGWSLNPGVIDRNMRSLPDDFNGDEVKKEFNVKPNLTFGIKTAVGFEVGGKGIDAGLEFGQGMTYNNYTGFGYSTSVDLKVSGSESNKSLGTLGLGLSAGSENGVGASLSFSKNLASAQGKDASGSLSGTVGLAYNSRAGLTALTLAASVTVKPNPKESSDYESSSSAAISFVSPTYMPASGHSMINTNLSIHSTLGGEIFPMHLNGKFEAYFAGQVLLDREETFPAYGYTNSQNAHEDKVLMDFNREKEGGFNENTPALPLTNYTYDIYSVSGQGIGGMYRAHRSDIGILHDSKTWNVAGGIDFPGLEVGIGNLAHVGVNFSLNESNSKSGKWEKDNEAATVLGFQGSTNDPHYEASYFKQAGEKTAETDETFFKDMGGFEPVRIALNHNMESAPTHTFYNEQGTNMHNTYRKSRARRNEAIMLLTAQEAKDYGDIQEIENYGVNDFTIKNTVDKTATDYYKDILKPGTIGRTDDFRGNHHTSQITTYRSDGAKYVYGIPAYNRTQDERTFAIEASPGDINTARASGTIAYHPGDGDDTKFNKKGLDHYFDKTVMPAYAHSYLLTEILSADYVDVTGNGPTDDDLGTYTKINYSRINDNYKWRVPYNIQTVNYNEGLRSIEADAGGDDKGSYVYGEKEIWYMHSIETKNYVAKFILSDRADGYGVMSDLGGFSADSKSQKLKSIELYTKQELMDFKNHPNRPMPLTPVKVVHFEYDYSLCPGIDNNIKKYGGAGTDGDGFTNQGGKLTLTGVYFTYGTSKRGKLSPYEFTYDTNNPSYNLKGYDRWGNYKENTTANPTAEFPYTDQGVDANNKPRADVTATSWLMNKIQLPSGGVINVNYEADDYAYVQDKRAMQMFKVIGVCKNAPGSLSALGADKNELYEGLTDGYKSKNFVVFELPNPNFDRSDIGKACFLDKEGRTMEHLYFRFLVNLNRTSLGQQAKAMEYVSGYATMKTGGYGNFDEGGKSYGWVELDPDPIADKIHRAPEDVNPVSQAGWCFTKKNLPILAYNKPRITDDKLLQIVKAVASTFKQLITMFDGFYNQMRIEGMAKEFDTNKSFIRLYNPVNAKKGGGVRVAKLALSDQWKEITTVNDYTDAEYGQEYTYTTTDNYGNTISSGVAAYEPLIGGDENPFRQPVSYEIEHKLSANEEFYQEKPYGESFFPGPSVGYSKVTVKNLQHTGVTKHATGYVVNEFYTAKDFPTITKQTTTEVKRVKPNPILKLLKIRCRDFMTATQGFCVELNNMHGQPKGTYVYAEGKEHPISGVKYIYKTSVKTLSMPKYVNEAISVGSLENNMLVLEEDGSVKTKMVGVDYDFITDMREDETVSRGAGIGGNVDLFLVSAIPAFFPSAWPSYWQERVRFRSAVTTKVINRYGILEETVAYDQGSVVSTKNKMLDAETGEVLLTETKNQFDDPIYSFNYPAHLAYDEMGPAYKNIGMTVYVNYDISNNPYGYFVPGDELEVFTLNPIASFSKVWIRKNAAMKFEAIDDKGVPVNLFNKYVKIIRSGRRNQSNVSLGSIVSKRSPLTEVNGKTTLTINSSIGILNTTATEFSDKWGLFCECGVQPGQAYNPYLKGTKGNWRSVRSWAQLTGRTQSRSNENTNVREDGVYTSFSPFWLQPTATTPYPWQISTGGWINSSEVTIYSPYGMELENKDALGISSSAIYGYNNSYPTAVAANAKYKQIAFDGFEDYGFGTCNGDHFSYKQVVSTPEGTKSHTGKNSIKVSPNSEISIKKTLIQCAPQPQ